MCIGNRKNLNEPKIDLLENICSGYGFEIFKEFRYRLLEQVIFSTVSTPVSVFHQMTGKIEQYRLFLNIWRRQVIVNQRVCRFIIIPHNYRGTRSDAESI